MKLISLLLLSVLMSCTTLTRLGVPGKADEVNPIKVGEEIKSAVVYNKKGKEVNLLDIIKDTKTALVFYRGGWCPYCNLQLQGLRKAIEPLKKNGYQVVALSSDSPESMKESLRKHKLNYRLYSDRDVNAAKSLGLAYQVDEKTNEKYLDYGINLRAASGRSHRILPVPAILLVDKKGMVVFQYVNPNYKVRLNEKVLIKASEVM